MPGTGEICRRAVAFAIHDAAQAPGIDLAAKAVDDTAGPAGLPARPAVLAAIVAATTARLVFAAGVGLEQDGAHSAEMARHFAWGYFDHPPLHYWLAGLAEQLSYAPFAIRLPFILLGAGSSWLLFQLTSLAFGERAGLWAVLGFSVCFNFTVLTPVFVAPDGPLVFFLLLAALLVARIVLPERPPPRPNLLWTGAGLAVGAALLSKYSAVFFIGGVFLFLVTARGQRKWLTTPGPWLGLAVATIIFLPVINWNARHEWASFAFQAARGLPSARGGIGYFFDNIGGQLGYLFPYFLPVLAIELIRAMRAGPGRLNTWLFACLAALPIAVFTSLNLFQRGLPHWSMPGWLFAFPLLGASTAQLGSRGIRAARWAIGVSAAVIVALAGLVVVHVRTAILDEWAERWLPPRPNTGNGLLWSFVDWRDLRKALDERGYIEGDDRFFASLEWSVYSRMDLAFGRDKPVLCVCPFPNEMRFPNDPAGFAGGTGLLVDLPVNFEQNAALIARAFDRRETLPPLRLIRDGTVVLELRVERGFGFRPAALRRPSPANEQVGAR
jgi:4-amino-4-deoxy-L-arabinose transferase-like glycosyltransferase